MGEIPITQLQYASSKSTGTNGKWNNASSKASASSRARWLALQNGDGDKAAKRDCVLLAYLQQAAKRY